MDDADKKSLWPDWKRTVDWLYEEDFNSPAWNRRMAEVNRTTLERREKFGFQTCPKCGAVHTALTVMCRKCSHAAVRACPECRGKRFVNFPVERPSFSGNVVEVKELRCRRCNGAGVVLNEE